MSELAPAGAYSATSLQGKLALITGATGGIGQATARLLASRGVSIAVHYYSSQAKADSLVSDLLVLNPSIKAAAFRADLGDYAAVRDLHKQVVETLGDPDILYNNAAMAGTVVGIKGKIQDVDVEMFERTWRANAGSAFLVSARARAPPSCCACRTWRSKLGDGWCFVRVSQQVGTERVSLTSYLPSQGEFLRFLATGGVVGPHYASSKSALHGIMHWVANQYCRTGIPTTAHLDLIPMGRFGQPEEIAAIVELLICNAYMTNKVRPNPLSSPLLSDVLFRWMLTMMMGCISKIVVADGGMLPSSFA
ncbi:hypothetical protein EW146_g5840 [Bondarzewia mesenterica]|uniref:Ketoreductase (KR) domain-containing protein n=1 Tax=Bondarzewia mesenterica TaxID=1095465 RepID=A0A4V3XEQ1_9AGAM|nr:hypothetical protein EW146_g5840 [Bondarzewia mesenterica]